MYVRQHDLVIYSREKRKQFYQVNARRATNSHKQNDTQI